jgi:DNA modification methylase
MPLQRASVSRELVQGPGPAGEFYLGDALGLLGELKEKYAGQVQLIYLDPPFLTGQSFEMSVRVGEGDWRRMAGSKRAHAFDDAQSPEAYYSMLKTVFEASRALLSEEGALFVHVDWRAHARLRLILDSIFGEQNFVNEIIWAYKSGGRAKKSFPKKHDVILFYRKSKSLFFDIDAVLEKRSAPPDNHMKRHVDPDGRVYRSIRSGGRTYTYYDDAPAVPTDVWDDISHLQQRDYERTGYDTQKPLRLLRRIVRCCSREGDLVMDLFAGACTSLEAAASDNRRFVGVDLCPLTVNIARRRLSNANATYNLGASAFCGTCEATAAPGIGLYHVYLDGFSLCEDALETNGLDAVDNWAAGYVDGDTFTACAHFERTQAHPRLQTELRVPVYDRQLAIRVGDVAGRSHYFLVESPRLNISAVE